MDESCGKLPIEINTPKALTNTHEYHEYTLSDEEGKANYSIHFGDIMMANL